jgi:hypothetical protein
VVFRSQRLALPSRRSADLTSTTSAFLQSIALVEPSQPAAAARLLSWTSRSLRHKSDSKVHSFGRVPRLPPFRLQGLATLLTACSLRTLAGLISCPPRPWDSPFGAFLTQGTVAFPTQLAHMLFFLPLIPTSGNSSARRSKPQLLGFVVASGAGRWPASSLGILLSRVFRSSALVLPSEALLSCA